MSVGQAKLHRSWEWILPQYAKCLMPHSKLLCISLSLKMFLIKDTRMFTVKTDIHEFCYTVSLYSTVYCILVLVVLP